MLLLSKVTQKTHITGSLIFINHNVFTDIIQLPQVIIHKKNEASRTYGC